jgi:hypothetical protein
LGKRLKRNITDVYEGEGGGVGRANKKLARKLTVLFFRFRLREKKKTFYRPLQKFISFLKPPPYDHDGIRSHDPCLRWQKRHQGNCKSS